jgi:hypothetical protein
MRGDSCLRVQRFFFSLVTIALLIVTGCMDEAQTIHIDKRVGDENKYEEFRKVTDNKQVEKAKKAIEETTWEKAKAEMDRPPDYQFIFQFKNPQIEAKAVPYRVWIILDNSQLEVIRGMDEYAKLTKENSAILFEVLTGSKLDDLK